MSTLRQYQVNAVGQLRGGIRDGHVRQVLCAPTGSGKTHIFTFIAERHIKKGGKVAIFTHRIELLKQAQRDFTTAPEVIESKTKAINPDHGLHICMTETVHRRMNKPEFVDWLKTRTLIVIDEAHLAIFDKLFEFIPSGCVVIGATATPYRKGKAATGLDQFYSNLIQTIDTPELIEAGFLCDAITYATPIDLRDAKVKAGVYDTSQIFETNKTYEGVLANYRRLTPNKKALLFASNVESSKRVCAEFVASGYPAKHIDGKTPKKKRPEILEWFDKTPNAILCNCGVLRAGYDQPDIEVIILYLATTSLPSYLQMCGRGSRISEGKEGFKILDFGNNATRLNLWQSPRTWSLEKVKSRSSKLQAAPVKDCEKCGAMNFATVRVCVACGNEFPKPKREDLPPVELERLVRRELSGKKIAELDLSDLIQLQQAKVYKAGFIWRVVRSRGLNELSAYANLMGYSEGWIYRQEGMIADSNFTNFTIR